jgi:hypothetical protein
MAVVVVSEEAGDFIDYKESGVAGIVPGLPVIQNAMQFPFFIAEQAHNRVCDVAQHHYQCIEHK